MLKRQWLFLFALIAVFSISSCSDDDDGPSNSAGVEDDKISLSKGYIITYEDYEDDNGEIGSMHAIYLVSKGLSIDENAEEFEGEGDLLVFVLFSASNDELDEGIYEIKSEYLPGNVVAFAMATEYNWNDGDAEYNNLYNASYGTVEVSKSGDTYTFDFKATSYTVNETEEGEGELTGHFKGKLEVIEVDNDAERVKNPLLKDFTIR